MKNIFKKLFYSPSKSMRFMRIALLLTLLALIIGGAWRYFRPTSPTQKEVIEQQRLSLEKAEDTIAAVEKLIEIPNEPPTVATINDLTKLRNQPFFAQAEEGDRVLFFTKAKKAILYRPTANKIIDVAALNLEK